VAIDRTGRLAMVDRPDAPGGLPVQRFHDLPMLDLELPPITAEQVGEDAGRRLAATTSQRRKSQSGTGLGQDGRDRGPLLARRFVNRSAAELGLQLPAPMTPPPSGQRPRSQVQVFCRAAGRANVPLSERNRGLSRSLLALPPGFLDGGMRHAARIIRRSKSYFGLDARALARRWAWNCFRRACRFVFFNAAASADWTI
jgi:hypothetical protein